MVIGQNELLIGFGLLVVIVIAVIIVVRNRAKNG